MGWECAGLEAGLVMRWAYSGLAWLGLCLGMGWTGQGLIICLAASGIGLGGHGQWRLRSGLGMVYSGHVLKWGKLDKCYARHGQACGWAGLYMTWAGHGWSGHGLGLAWHIFG